MQLTLANHPITDLQFGAPARLDGTVLVVDADSLGRVVLQEPAFVGVHFEIARPGEPCRAGPIFDVIEPRAKAPAGGADFPGILGGRNRSRCSFCFKRIEACSFNAFSTGADPRHHPGYRDSDKVKVGFNCPFGMLSPAFPLTSGNSPVMFVATAFM